MNTAATMKPPMYWARPHESARSPAKPRRDGPTTAPMVPAQTMSDTALPLRSGMAMSAAAYRDSWDAA
jgi:hypothetical protein